MSNKRKAKTVAAENSKTKQRSIVNFFSQVVKKETISVELSTTKPKNQISQVAQLNNNVLQNESTTEVEPSGSAVEPTDKLEQTEFQTKLEPTKDDLPTEEPHFFTNSMYTDEFNLMLETVLEGEKFLFDQEETRIFETFQALKGLSLFFFFLQLCMRSKNSDIIYFRRTKASYCSFIDEKIRLDQKRQIKISSVYS